MLAKKRRTKKSKFGKFINEKRIDKVYRDFINSLQNVEYGVEIAVSILREQSYTHNCYTNESAGFEVSTLNWAFEVMFYDEFIDLVKVELKKHNFINKTNTQKIILSIIYVLENLDKDTKKRASEQKRTYKDKRFMYLVSQIFHLRNDIHASSASDLGDFSTERTKKHKKIDIDTFSNTYLISKYLTNRYRYKQSQFKLPI